MPVLDLFYIARFSFSFEKCGDVILDIDWLPGRILLVVFFGLSLYTWAVILSKALQLSRFRYANLSFTQALKSSQSSLSIFREGVCYDPAPLFAVYESAAQRIALQHRSHQEMAREHALSTAGGVGWDEFGLIETAFEKGEREVTRAWMRGFGSLWWISYVVPLIGLLVGCYAVVQALNSELLDFQRYLSHAGILILASFLVAVPAGIGRLYLSNRYRDMAGKVHKFRSELVRVFKAEHLAARPRPAKKAVIVSTKSKADDEATLVISNVKKALSVRVDDERLRAKYQSLTSVDE